MAEDRERLQNVARLLEAIRIRCREGDKRSDWLPVIDRLATEALSEIEPHLAALDRVRALAADFRTRGQLNPGWYDEHYKSIAASIDAALDGTEAGRG